MGGAAGKNLIFSKLKIIVKNILLVYLLNLWYSFLTSFSSSISFSISLSAEKNFCQWMEEQENRCINAKTENSLDMDKDIFSPCTKKHGTKILILSWFSAINLQI